MREPACKPGRAYGRFTPLAGLLLACVASLVLLAGVIAERARERTDVTSMSPEEIESRLKSDLPLGSRIDFTGLRDLKGNAIGLDPVAGDAICLFTAGPKLRSCSTCGAEEFLLEFNALARDNKHVPVWFIWAGQKDLAGLSVEDSLYRDGRLALDPDLEVSRRLNVFFYPRVYVVSREGRLKYVSPFGTLAREVSEEVRRTIGAKGREA